MWRKAMQKQYSIAQARNDLPAIVHQVELDSPVELTRRGKPVAVIVSFGDYQRLTKGRKRFWEAVEEWRQSVDLEELNIGPEVWEGVRDRSPGREFQW
jgi:antitoxin Phd